MKAALLYLLFLLLPPLAARTGWLVAGLSAAATCHPPFWADTLPLWPWRWEDQGLPPRGWRLEFLPFRPHLNVQDLIDVFDVQLGRLHRLRASLLIAGTARFLLEYSRSLMRLLSVFGTAILVIPYQWSNQTNETNMALTASKITCDPDSYESSHD